MSKFTKQGVRDLNSIQGPKVVESDSKKDDFCAHPTNMMRKDARGWDRCSLCGESFEPTTT